MFRHLNYKKFSLILLSSLIFYTPITHSATPIDLKNQDNTLLTSFSSNAALTQIKQKSSTTDFNHTQHLRLQQFYAGYPVWGADFILHIPQGNISSLKQLNTLTEKLPSNMDGIIYKNIEQDLNKAPNYLLNDTQEKTALEQAILSYQKLHGTHGIISDKKIETIIFITQDNKAHWAFLISFHVNIPNTSPQKPTYILDALSLTIYKTWDDLHTLVDTFGGGIGGNEKTTQFFYDGQESHQPKLNIQRDPNSKICYLSNKDVVVKNANNTNEAIQFSCPSPDTSHGNIYWNTIHDAINGGYSPSNDALFVGKIIKDMYQQWYGIPVLSEKGAAMMLTMLIHLNIDNAYWDGEHKRMFFGDGIHRFYPLVSLDVGAHEVSHGFTQQHSNLVYHGQSGALNEAFSDMAGEAAEYYAYTTHKTNTPNNWMVGDSIIKQKNKALRYMDDPTKDCDINWPEKPCSISHYKDYNDTLNVHYSSGIFNKLFYQLATSDGWDIQKAFNVMVQANRYYWTATTDFTHAACGVLKAINDYKYSATAFKNAAANVGISLKIC